MNITFFPDYIAFIIVPKPNSGGIPIFKIRFTFYSIGIIVFCAFSIFMIVVYLRNSRKDETQKMSHAMRGFSRFLLDSLGLSWALSGLSWG